MSGRYPDIALATSDFAKNIQQALDIVQNQSQMEPVQASALNKEILVLLRSYNDILAQNRANIPNDLQPIIEKVDIGSQSSARHSYNDNHSGEGRGNDGDPAVLSTMTPLIIILSTGTPVSSSEFTD